MAELIIGHTTEDSATIWIRGESRHRFAQVTLETNGGSISHREAIRLRADSDFTAVARFDATLDPTTKLEPSTTYRVRARFAATEKGLDEGATEVKGRLRTFPDPEARPDRDFGAEPFCFLHGACNLSVVTLTNLGALGAGVGGMLMGTRSRETPRRGNRWWDRALRVGDWISWRVYCGYYWLYQLKSRHRWLPLRIQVEPEVERKQREELSIVHTLFYALYQRSGFKQPKPMLPSPFRELIKQLKGVTTPAFMIHAGDQIYFDVPEARRQPAVEEYRLAYQEAWFEDPALRCFFRTCPQYMTLDDHDIVEAFPHIRSDGSHGASAKERVDEYRGPAIQVYKEYVHSRHPQKYPNALYYDFQHGGTHFFVLDSRNERDIAAGNMIGKDQLTALRSWLEGHAKDLKFVVSAVPFVAEISPEAVSPDGRKEKEDKWCGETFRGQREELIEFLLNMEIEKLVFLVGDVHCTYHARMQIGTPQKRVTVHELAGGPTHQLQFSRCQDFLSEHRATTRGGVPYRSWLGEFYASASGVLMVDVDRSSKIGWRVLHTSPRLGEDDPDERPKVLPDERRRLLNLLQRRPVLTWDTFGAVSTEIPELEAKPRYPRVTRKASGQIRF